MQDQTPPFAGLTPDVVLNAIDAHGLATSGQLLALNSYENRVFQVGLDEPLPNGATFAVAKFYRPQRWSDAQILEEHAFVAELEAAEIPVVPALVLGGTTLHQFEGFRLAVFARRGGRAPELDDRSVREWLGRFIGRIHAIGARSAYTQRPALDAETFGVEPSTYLLTHAWLPPDVREVYRGVVAQALAEVAACYRRAGAVRALRLHGDCHEGNVLWTDGAKSSGPHFVDFDDSRMGPAVQDLWMLAPERRALDALLEGYAEFRDFDYAELALIEPLRVLRQLHWAGWIAARWEDPAFPAGFPFVGEARWWEQHVTDLHEAMDRLG